MYFAVLGEMDSSSVGDDLLNNCTHTSYDTDSEGVSLRSAVPENTHSVLNSPLMDNISFLPDSSPNPNLTLRNTSPKGEFDINTDVYFQKNQKWQKTTEKALLDSGAVQIFVDKN